MEDVGVGLSALGMSDESSDCYSVLLDPLGVCATLDWMFLNRLWHELQSVRLRHVSTRRVHGCLRIDDLLNAILLEPACVVGVVESQPVDDPRGEPTATEGYLTHL